jgi:hypothetical protein
MTPGFKWFLIFVGCLLLGAAMAGCGRREQRPTAPPEIQTLDKDGISCWRLYVDDYNRTEWKCEKK